MEWYQRLRKDEPAPKLEGADAVVHLAGENLAQRWTDGAKREILASREQGTRRLVEALGFDTRAPSPHPIDDAVPAMAFVDPARGTRAAVSRAHGASRTFTVGAVLFVALLVAFVLLLAFAR